MTASREEALLIFAILDLRLRVSDGLQAGDERMLLQLDGIQRMI